MCVPACVRMCVRAGDRTYFICKKGTLSSNVKENSCEFSFAYVFYFYEFSFTNEFSFYI